MQHNGQSAAGSFNIFYTRFVLFPHFACYLCAVKKQIFDIKRMRACLLKGWQKVRPCTGLPLLYIGVALMAGGSLLPQTCHNAVNLAALLMVYAGAIGYVVQKKHRS